MGSRFPSKKEVKWVIASSCIPGVVVGMNHGKNIGVQSFFCSGVNVSSMFRGNTIEPITLPICLWVVRASPQLLDPSHLT